MIRGILTDHQILGPVVVADFVDMMHDRSLRQPLPKRTLSHVRVFPLVILTHRIPVVVAAADHRVAQSKA